MIVLAAVVGSPDRSISVNTGVFPAKYGEVPLGVYLQTPEYVCIMGEARECGAPSTAATRTQFDRSCHPKKTLCITYHQQGR